jgi:hypothetical protein
MFGIPDDVFVGIGGVGLGEIVVQDFYVRYSNQAFAEVSLTGILSDGQKIKHNTNLSQIPFTVLLEEVSRRIKTGENKREPMK